MKHVKRYEHNHQAMVVNATMTIVDFTGGGDGIYALYIDGELEKYGDYYHDKIESWIEGFVDGIKWSGVNVIYNKAVCDEGWVERTSEWGDEPPNLLEDAINPPKVNELFGIGNTIRSLRNQDELEAREVYDNLVAKKHDKIYSSEKKVRDGVTKIFTFSSNEDSIRIEMTNFLPIRTPGTTDYELFINNKIMECSRKISRDIWNLCNKISKSSKS